MKHDVIRKDPEVVLNLSVQEVRLLRKALQKLEEKDALAIDWDWNEACTFYAEFGDMFNTLKNCQ